MSQQQPQPIDKLQIIKTKKHLLQKNGKKRYLFGFKYF